MKQLGRQFFERTTLVVARDLLGKYLVRQTSDSIIAEMITETEAYIGQKDLACHASKGRTPRTEVMFGPAGHAYIYLIYGMHFCLNIVTEREKFPSAVLLRGVQNINGPGRLTKHFGINASLKGADMTVSKEIWVEDRGAVINPRDIVRTPRIGVDYAGAYKDKKWRFVLKYKNED